MDEKIKGHCQRFGPVTITHNFNRQKVDECIQIIKKNSERAIAEKLNTGSASVRLLQVYIMPDTTIVLPLQQQQGTMDLNCFTSSLQPGFGSV